jgi:mRNA interferase MazF
MLLSKEIRQGDVYWLDFGSSSGSAPADRHPCVVVQSDVFNRTRIATTVVCLITSNLGRAAAPGNVALKRHDAHLPKPSVVNVSQIVTVDKSDLQERIGHLPAAALTSVLQGLQLIFEPAGP